MNHHLLVAELVQASITADSDQELFAVAADTIEHLLHVIELKQRVIDNMGGRK